jgi:hypothetical protein
MIGLEQRKILVILGAALILLPMLAQTNNVKANVLDYNTTTKGVHDWLKRPDGTFCMNDKSLATVEMQKAYQDAKDMGLNPSLSMNPWPLLCSTPEEQGQDYIAHENDPSYFDKVIPPSENYTTK